MKECPACKEPAPVRSRNDVGFFKADGVKPVRLYQWLCQECGLVSTGAADPASDVRRVNGEVVGD